MLMIAATSRGLTLKDMDNMTVGQIVDYVIVHNNLHVSDDDTEDRVVEATQGDFDRF